ncbi:MAG TPA: hypothetical protein VID05_08050, partial [Acidimicrobiales bacterium]
SEEAADTVIVPEGVDGDEVVVDPDALSDFFEELHAGATRPRTARAASMTVTVLRKGASGDAG